MQRALVALLRLIVGGVVMDCLAGDLLRSVNALEVVGELLLRTELLAAKAGEGLCHEIISG